MIFSRILISFWSHINQWLINTRANFCCGSLKSSKLCGYQINSLCFQIRCRLRLELFSETDLVSAGRKTIVSGECYVNNYKIPVKTQHIISIMLYSDVFRLARVIIRLSLTIFKVYKVTVHIWDPKGFTWVLLYWCYSACDIVKSLQCLKADVVL